MSTPEIEQTPEQSVKETVAKIIAKARLRNFGEGTLEFNENTVNFYVEKGRFRKRQEKAKEIPIADIESVEKEANELSITSKGVPSYFILEKATLAEELHTEITRALKEQRKTSEDAGEAKKKQEEVTEVMPPSTETVLPDSAVTQELTKDQTVAEEAVAEKAVAEKAGVESEAQQEQEKLAGAASESAEPVSAEPVSAGTVSTEPVASEPAATTVTKDFGKGALDVVDNAVKFYVEKGLLMKRKEIAEAIPLAEIEDASLDGKRIGIVRSGIMEMFTVTNAESAAGTYEEIAKVLKEQQEIRANQEAAKLEQQQLIVKLNGALEVTDGLFDLINGLHGRVDWDEMNDCAKNSGESVNLLNHEVQIVNLEFAQLSSAIKERKTEEISRITFNGLKSLYDHFSELSTKSPSLEQSHPNYQDARVLIQSYYTLNDIILGDIVGDQNIAEEIKEFLTMIDILSKQASLAVNTEALREAASKLQAENAKDSVIREFRSVFKQQLKNLIAP